MTDPTPRHLVSGTSALAASAMTSSAPTSNGPTAAGLPMHGTRPALQVVRPTTTPAAPDDIPPPPVGVLVRGLLEVVSGWRPAAQMALLTTPEIAADLLARPRRRTAGRPPQVQRIRALRVADDVVEACAVFRRPQRCGALALRLEYGSRGWLVTRLQVG